MGENSFICCIYFWALPSSDNRRSFFKTKWCIHISRGTIFFFIYCLLYFFYWVQFYNCWSLSGTSLDCILIRKMALLHYWCTSYHGWNLFFHLGEASTLCRRYCIVICLCVSLTNRSVSRCTIPRVKCHFKQLFRYSRCCPIPCCLRLPRTYTILWFLGLWLSLRGFWWNLCSQTWPRFQVIIFLPWWKFVKCLLVFIRCLVSTCHLNIGIQFLFLNLF